MQYLLSKEEYDRLMAQATSNSTMPSKAKLQSFCTMVANKLPILYWNNEEPMPWGCYLTEEEEWYCDKCPCQEVCPAPKSWSK
jgi:hypothetical protein